MLGNAQEAIFFLVLERASPPDFSWLWKQELLSCFLVFFSKNAFPVKSIPLRYRFDEKVMNVFTTVLSYPEGKQKENTIRISASYFFKIFLLKVLKDCHLAKKTDLYFYSAWIYQMKRATFG